MPRFEKSHGRSGWFWEISQCGATLLLRYGRVGGRGRTKELRLDSSAEALEQLQVRIAAKRRKGYEPVGPAASDGDGNAGAASASPAAASASPAPASASPAAASASPAPASASSAPADKPQTPPSPAQPAPPPLRKVSTARLRQAALRETEAPTARRDRPGDGDAALRTVELDTSLSWDRDDVEAYLLYGEWLRRLGDPRGRLIEIQHELSGSPDPQRASELRAAEQRLMSESARQLLGDLAGLPAGALSLRWHLGFVRTVWVALDHPAWRNNTLSPGAALASLLRHPSGRFIKELSIGVQHAPVDATGFEEVVTALARLSAATSLDSLLLGDVREPGEGQIAWSLGPVSELYRVFPGLVRLWVQSGPMRLAPIVAEQLEECVVMSSSLEEDNVAALCNARWPRLRRLEIAFGAGSPRRAESLRPLLEGRGVPELRHLALMDTEASDKICELLLRLPLVKQLQSLELSHGCLTDRGARAVVESRHALSGLERLHLGYNFLSLQAAAELSRLSCEVTVEPQYRR